MWNKTSFDVISFMFEKRKTPNFINSMSPQMCSAAVKTKRLTEIKLLILTTSQLFLLSQALSSNGALSNWNRKWKFSKSFFLKKNKKYILPVFRNQVTIISFPAEMYLYVPGPRVTDSRASSAFWPKNRAFHRANFFEK